MYFKFMCNKFMLVLLLCFVFTTSFYAANIGQNRVGKKNNVSKKSKAGKRNKAGERKNVGQKKNAGKQHDNLEKIRLEKSISEKTRRSRTVESVLSQRSMGICVEPLAEEISDCYRNMYADSAFRGCLDREQKGWFRAQYPDLKAEKPTSLLVTIYLRCQEGE